MVARANGDVAYAGSESVNPNGRIWHARIAHQGSAVLKAYSKIFNLRDPPTDDEIDRMRRKDCDACLLGDMHAHPIHSKADEQYSATRTLGLVVADLMGPFSIIADGTRIRSKSLGGHYYILVVVDVYTHMVWVILLVKKSDASERIIKLLTRLHLQTGEEVGIFRTDKGGEFFDSTLATFFDIAGTEHTWSQPGIKGHNGIAERMNRTIQSMARKMMSHADAPPPLWGEAVIWASHVHNATPQKIVEFQPPFQLFRKYNFKPNRLKVWGCDAFVQHKETHKLKFEPRGWRGIFVGFHSESGGYRVLHPTTGTIETDRNVEFQEENFRHMKMFADSCTEGVFGADGPYAEYREGKADEDDSDYSPSESDSDSDTEEEPSNPPPVGGEGVKKKTQKQKRDQNGPDVKKQNPSDPKQKANTSSSTSSSNNEQAAKPNLRRSERRAKYITNPIMLDPANYGHHASEGVDDVFGEMQQAYCAHMSFEYPIWEMVLSAYTAEKETEPKNFKEAIEQEVWKKSMLEELESLRKLGVYKLVQLPKNKHALGTRFVYKLKLDDENKVSRRKSRFVVQGFRQVYGRDYEETHSPVANIKSIKMVLSVAARRDYELLQMDFDTAFLNAVLDEEVFVKQPQGFHVGGPDMVWKLNKALYGLKQASRQWYKTIHAFMMKIGYEPLKTDPCVYKKISQTGKLMLVCLYVDDTMIAVHKDDVQEWERDKARIADAYPIKDLGECQWILNMKVTRDRAKRVITLSQRAYIERITTERGMAETRTVSTPVTPGDFNMPIDPSKDLDEEQTTYYQSLIGALLYVANITRPDVAYAIGRLCQVTIKPNKIHLEIAKRVLRYLYQTRHYTMTFGGPRAMNPTLEGYSDSDWAGCLETRRSTSGCLVRFNGDVISWMSRRQKTVALSSAEAEYMALSEVTKEIIWYRTWIWEVFGIWTTGLVYEDNQATKAIAEGVSTIRDRTKHIDIRYRFINEAVQDQKIKIQWIDTQHQQADILTKPLSGGTFERICNMILDVNE
jgi:transposase InsO family protein